MANKETLPQMNAKEYLAQVLVGNIKIDDSTTDGENDKVLFSFLVGLMQEDPIFERNVRLRVKQLQEAQGVKTQLLPPEALKNAKRHPSRSREVKHEALPPSLFPEEYPATLSLHTNQPEVDERILSIGQNMDGKRYGRHKLPFDEEIRHYKNDLRSKINLPVPRKKDPNYKDDFYKFLVRRIVHGDRFKIFTEFDRAMQFDNMTEELRGRIDEVGEFIKKILESKNIIQERFREYHKFCEEYDEKYISGK